MNEQPDQPQITPSLDDPAIAMPIIDDSAALLNPTDQLPAVEREEAERRFGPRALKRLVVVGLFALTGSGCVPQIHDSTPETQQDVASAEVFGTSIGLEGDANGIANTREATDVPTNQYESDGSVVDSIGGLPNLVIGVPDQTADGAPEGDGWIMKHESSKESSSTTETTHSTKEVEVKTPRIETIVDEKVVSDFDSGNTQYERDFETDSATFDQALTPAERVAAETLALVEEGYTVNAVVVTGLASGEDHTDTGPNANIGESSQNNLDLSMQRAQAGDAALGQSLRERGIDTSTASLVVGGQEIEPTPEQFSKLQSAAEDLGITIGELTERFNTFAGNFSPEQLTLLNETLTNNRGVLYEIHASKQQTVATGNFETTIIKIPTEVITSLGGSEEKSDWLLRVEIPGEVLLLLAALAAIKLAGNLPAIPLPSLPGTGVTAPRIPKPVSPTAEVPVDIPPVVGPKPPGRVEPPPPPPPIPRERERFPRPSDQPDPRQRYDSVKTPRKQPREYNFSKNRSNLAGGKGRTERDRGGSRRGKR